MMTTCFGCFSNKTGKEKNQCIQYIEKLRFEFRAMLRSSRTTRTSKFISGYSSSEAQIIARPKNNCMQSEFCLYSAILLLTAQFTTGSVAEWSKALVLGTSLFGGASSNLAAIKQLFLFLGFMNNCTTKTKYCAVIWNACLFNHP